MKRFEAIRKLLDYLPYGQVISFGNFIFFEGRSLHVWHLTDPAIEYRVIAYNGKIYIPVADDELYTFPSDAVVISTHPDTLTFLRWDGKSLWKLSTLSFKKDYERLKPPSKIGSFEVRVVVPPVYDDRVLRLPPDFFSSESPSNWEALVKQGVSREFVENVLKKVAKVPHSEELYGRLV